MRPPASLPRKQLRRNIHRPNMENIKSYQWKDEYGVALVPLH